MTSCRYSRPGPGSTLSPRPTAFLTGKRCRKVVSGLFNAGSGHVRRRENDFQRIRGGKGGRREQKENLPLHPSATISPRIAIDITPRPRQAHIRGNNLLVLFAPRHQPQDSFRSLSPASVQRACLFPDLAAHTSPFRATGVIKGTFDFTGIFLIFRAAFSHYFAFR